MLTQLILQENLSLPLENIIYFKKKSPWRHLPALCACYHMTGRASRVGSPGPALPLLNYTSLWTSPRRHFLLLGKGGVGAITSSSRSWWKDLKRWGIWWLVDQSLKSSNIGNGYWRFQNFEEPGFPFSSHQHFHSLREAPPRIPVILFSALSLIYMILQLTENNLKRLSRYV